MTLPDESGVPYVRLIRAPNPGPMTLDGTNTWVIADQGAGALVIDPGPAIVDHLEAILAASGPRLVTIVLTHRHLDHSEGAPGAGRASWLRRTSRRSAISPGPGGTRRWGRAARGCAES